MFNFFGRKDNECPINEEVRQKLESHFMWLVNTFGKEYIQNKKILTPERKDFPIQLNGTEQTALELLKIISKQMDINVEDIHLDFYQGGLRHIGSGAGLGDKIFMGYLEGEKYSGGLYFGKQEDNKYHVGLEKSKLKEPVDLIATLAHELSHIKLLGEKRIEKNNEYLTDLTTIIFGLGIFNANAAFQTKNNYDFSGWSKLGYLSQMEWGYALALYAYIREESQPEWIKHLSKNIESDFKISQKFIRNNPEKLFKSSSLEESTQAPTETRKKTLNYSFDKSNQMNNQGYALIREKKYKDAISYFDKAIEINPQFDYPYNNRGYCFLQLEDFENAFEDIQTACEINPFNSFAWRNLGAYYLKRKEFEKALGYFEEAEKLDPQTELINFYLAKAHEKLNNSDKAKHYMDKSIEWGEYNDTSDIN